MKPDWGNSKFERKEFATNSFRQILLLLVLIAIGMFAGWGVCGRLIELLLVLFSIEHPEWNFWLNIIGSALGGIAGALTYYILRTDPTAMD